MQCHWTCPVARFAIRLAFVLLASRPTHRGCRSFTQVTLEQATSLRRVPRPLSFLSPRHERSSPSSLSSRSLQQYIFPEGWLHLNGQITLATDLLDSADAWLSPDVGTPESPMLALWKPQNIITTMDSQEPKSLVPLLGASSCAMHIGRLDKGTTGLLLLSSNGDLHRILLAQGGITKKYVVTEACSSSEMLRSLK